MKTGTAHACIQPARHDWPTVNGRALTTSAGRSFRPPRRRRFSQRLPGAKPSLFIDQLLGEKILSDSITATAQRGEVVKVLTVHSAKGLEWQFVALAGMQEGSWPNLKQRGSLLGSERLVEIFRHGISNAQQLDAISAAGLSQDEKRLLNVALSRANKKVLITAVAHEDNQP